MKHLEVEKIEQKKTKTVLTTSFSTKDPYLKPEDAFKRHLAIAVISGGNTNIVRQVLNGGLSQELNYDLFDELKNKMNLLIADALMEIERVEDLQELDSGTRKFI